MQHVTHSESMVHTELIVSNSLSSVPCNVQDKTVTSLKLSW